MTRISLNHDATLSPRDEQCLRLLVDSGLFPRSVIEGLCSWWSGTRTSGETLPAFLVRNGVFLPFTIEELEQIEKSYVRFTTIHPFFAPGGIHRLQEKALGTVPAAAADDTHVFSSAIQETVQPSRDETPSKREEPAQPATELLKVIAAALPASRTVPASQPADMVAGTTLGGFTLIRSLGRGPKGLVFEAESADRSRSLAVKVLAPDMAARGAAWVQRFLQEARVTGRADHPLILQIIAVGEDRGLVYFVTPLMRGGSARDVLKSSGPFAPIDATRIIRKTALALAAAHGLGLSHGNLKPSNIFLCENGDVKIADFMIPHLPLNHAETIALRAQDVAADLRMLGATYQRILTGQPPLNAPQFDLWDSGKQTGGRPPIPDQCAKIIAAVLSRKRATSYSSAAAMADALAAAEESLRTSGTGFRPARRSSAAVAASAPNASPLPSHGLAGVGKILGKCLLTERIGQGSSGVVFRAQHQTLGVSVAVKVLHVAGEGNVYCQLRSEARLLAQLNHPHIVRVWDFDDDPTLPYLVLEYVAGKSLSELLRQYGRMDPARAVQIVAQVASGLAAAHRLGIVHRDVKPGNILLAEDGTAKLADLGLAVFVDQASRDKVRGRRPAGTVAYMPPEQTAAVSVVDHRSDIYALGASFYHLVTGQIPFHGSSRAEVIAKHANEPPAPPHQRVPGLPPATSDVILKMLEKAPADRYQTYEELAAALDALKRTLCESTAGCGSLTHPTVGNGEARKEA